MNWVDAVRQYFVDLVAGGFDKLNESVGWPTQAASDGLHGITGLNFAFGDMTGIFWGLLAALIAFAGVLWGWKLVRHFLDWVTW